MKKHRKLVALLVALTFLFSVVAPAMAADAADPAQISADKLNVLGIIEGYPDGSFGLDRNITRAEFAKIAVATAGLTEAAEQLVNFPSQFSDVATGEWYTGWINMAASQGFVKGDPAGTFRPNDNITYAEVVTVLVRLLGYNDNLTGPWPTNYLAKAVELDITEGVALNASAPAVRGDVFIMADNTLDCNTVIWSTDRLTWLVNKDEKLIVKSFKGSMYEGLVTDIRWDSRGDIYLDLLFTDEDDDLVKDTVKLVDNVIVTGADDAYGLVGKQVEFIRNQKTSGADKKAIVYLGLKDTDSVSKDSVKYFKNDYIEVDKKKYYLADSNFGITYFPVGDDWDDDNLYANEDRKADNIVVVLNEDGDAQWVFVYNFSEADYDVIDEIDGNKVFGFTNVNIEYDAKKVQVFVKDGVIADFDALAEGDLIYVVEGVNNTDLLVVAVSETFDGELEKSNSDGTELTIDGSKFKGSNYLISTDGGDDFNVVDLDKLDDAIGETVSYMLNPAGKLGALISDTKATQKLIGVVEATMNSVRGLETRILTPDGSKAVYYVDTDYSSNFIKNVGGEIDQNTGEVNRYMGAPVLVEYSLDKNGRIDYVKAAIPGKEFKEYDGMRAEIDDEGWLRVDSNAAFFGEDSGGKRVATDWDTFKKAASINNVQVIISKGTVKAMYVAAPIVDDENIGVIAGTGRDRNGFFYEVFFDGEKVRYNVTGDVKDDVDADIIVGNGTLVEFGLTSGKVSDIVVLGVSDYVYGEVKTASSDRIEIDGEGYYYIDSEDTMIIDATSRSSVKLANRVSRGQFVKVYESDKGIVKVIVICKEADMVQEP